MCLVKKYIGIDIGSCYIKIVNITVNRDSVILDSPVIVKTPRFLVQNGRITDKDELSNLLKKSIQTEKLKKRKAVVILNDSLVITRDIELPPSKPREIEEMIKLDASEYLPFDVKEYTIRHRILFPYRHNPKKVNYVLMASVKNDLVMDFYEVFRNVGLKLTAIDVSINSMIKFFKHMMKEDSRELVQSKTIAMFDLGASTVKIVIFDNGIPVFQQILNHSSQKIDIMIADTMGIEREQAEDYKKKYGLSYLYDDNINEEARIVGSIVNTQVDLMMADAYKYLQSFINRSDSKPVDELLLTGGMSHLKGMRRYMQEAFSIPCNIVQAKDLVGFPMSGINEDIQFFTNIAGAVYRGD